MLEHEQELDSSDNLQVTVKIAMKMAKDVLERQAKAEQVEMAAQTELARVLALLNYYSS